MKKLLLAIFLLVSIVGFGQYKSSHETVGRILSSSEPIQAKVYTFDDYIYQCTCDTTHNTMLLQVRETRRDKYWKDSGTVYYFGLDNKEPIWHKNTNYQKEIYYLLGENIFVIDVKKNTCLYPQTGTKKWANQTQLFYADYEKGIGLGYESDGNQMQCIDLETGKVKWEHPIVREFGWEEIGYLNDTTLFLVANGIHVHNLRDGKGWDVNLQSGDESYAAAGAAAAGGIALGLLTGFYSIPDVGATITKGMISNSLIDSTSFYLAAKKRIVRANRATGELIWNHPFKKDCGSSQLMMDDSLVYMIHKASAEKRREDIVVGKPFFAAFDRNTGEERFHTDLPSKTSVIDYEILHDTLFILCKDQIFTCSMKNGAFIEKTNFTGKNHGEPLYFANFRFMKDDPDKVYFPIVYSDSDAVFLFTNEGSILRVDTKLDVSCAVEAMQFKYLRNACGPFFLIEDNDKTILYAEDRTKFAEIDYTNLFVVGTTAIKKLKNQIVLIDLKPLIDTAPIAEPKALEQPTPNLDTIREPNELPEIEKDSVQ
ncbi:MAG: PQQ-like beta-propeller repeat protein [Bacteroidales bacterium]|nr:PQQ-like beta-propeller repeat protein [Bacteroidales bacterium]